MPRPGQGTFMKLNDTPFRNTTHTAVIMTHGESNPLRTATAVPNKTVHPSHLYAHSTAYYTKVKCTQLGLAGVCWLSFKAPSNATSYETTSSTAMLIKNNISLQSLTRAINSTFKAQIKWLLVHVSLQLYCLNTACKNKTRIEYKRTQCIIDILKMKHHMSDGRKEVSCRFHTVDLTCRSAAITLF